MAQPAENVSITPVFYTEVVEDVNASRLAGRPVMVEEDRVEYRIAGNRNFNPHFLAHEFHEKVNGEEITHAMRFSDEYKRFKETGGNLSRGTPLENLPGLTPVQKSTLKALSVFSIEALANLEGRDLKNLGPGGHEMKQAAQKFLDVGSGRVDMSKMLSEFAALKAQNDELSRIVQAGRPEPVEIRAEPNADLDDFIERVEETVAKTEQSHNFENLVEMHQADPYVGVLDTELKDRIEKLAGQRPRGNPNRETLVGMLSSLEGE